MFYLDFQNQLQLLLLLVISSYIFLSGLSAGIKDPFMKAVGFSFVIPLILGTYSFLAGPYNIGIASLYLDLAWCLLILVLTLISLIRSSALVRFLYPVILLLPIVAVFMQTMLLEMDCMRYMMHTALVLAAIQLIMTVARLMGKNRSYLALHMGIFLMALGYTLDHSDVRMPLLVYASAASGLALVAIYFYMNTYGRLKAELIRNREELERLRNSIHAEVIRRVREIEQANKKLADKSNIDNMTGLYLKSAILDIMESMIQRSPRSQFSLLMVDIDQFKAINDNQGHQIGDQCIKSLAKLIQASFRKGDIPGRYGGDEFTIILPDTSATRAYLIAERFRKTVQGKTNPGITVSMGIAAYPEDGNSAASLIAAANQALSVSKKNGRNRVTCYNQVANGS